MLVVGSGPLRTFNTSSCGTLITRNAEATGSLAAPALPGSGYRPAVAARSKRCPGFLAGIGGGGAGLATGAAATRDGAGAFLGLRRGRGLPAATFFGETLSLDFETELMAWGAVFVAVEGTGLCC